MAHNMRNAVHDLERVQKEAQCVPNNRQAIYVCSGVLQKVEFS